VSPSGEVIGEFETTGVRPAFMERLKIAGVDVSADLFTEGMGR
jgi:hypothetical protein